LLDIYPAREEPIPGVTSEIILKDITAPEKLLMHADELVGWVRANRPDVLVTFGAGNIDRLVEPVAEALRSKI